MPKGSKKPCLKIPPRKIFFGHRPHPGLNQGPFGLRSNALLTEPRRRKVFGKKTSAHKHHTIFCISFMNRSFFPQNFSSPWLSQQCVRPQTERSLVQSRVGAMPKKILREGIFKLGFLEPFDIKFEGLDSLLHRSGLFIQIHLGVVCCNYDGKKIVDEHRQKYVEIAKNCLGIEIADERLRFLQTKHLQCVNPVSER